MNIKVKKKNEYCLLLEKSREIVEKQEVFR